VISDTTNVIGMGWMGPACRTQQRSRGKSCKILVRKIKMKRFRKQVCRWEDNIKIKFSELECTCTGVDWSSMVQDKKWRAL
jgi:hypothetical protein